MATLILLVVTSLAMGQSQMFPLYGPTVCDGTSNFTADFNLAGTYDVRCQYIPGGLPYNYVLRDLTADFDVWVLSQETETHHRSVNFVQGHTYRTSATPGPFEEPGNCEIRIKFWNSVCYSVEDVWGLAAVELPTTLAINTYPEPFNPEVNIAYNLPQASEVTLSIYNISGKLLNTLVDGYCQAGDYLVTYNGSDLPSGVYIYRLQAGNFNARGTMTLLK